MENNRQALIGIFLITLILSGWMIFNSTRNEPEKNISQQQAAISDSSKNNIPSATSPTQTPRRDSLAIDQSQATPEKLFVVETDLYRATISSKGASIVRWELKKFNAWYSSAAPVQLVHDGEKEFSFSFMGRNGQKVDSRYVDCILDVTTPSVMISGDKTYTLKARMIAGNGGTVERSYTFHGDSYMVDADISFNNMDNVIPSTQRWFDIGWNRGLQYQERSSVDESNTAVAFASLNGSLDELDADKFEKKSIHQSGKVEFIGSKSKYFIVSILNRAPSGEADYYLDGLRIGAPDNGYSEEYSTSYRVAYKGGVQTNSYGLYLGPLDYDIVKKSGMQSTVNFGWKWLIRPIGEYFMLPIFNAIHVVIPNFGIAIIVFSILMKVLLTPLSLGQLKMAQKMRVLQPDINALREKYGDDMMKFSQEQSKLLAEYGISPLPTGGCLPLLLQMPILFALYNVLSTNIQMRQTMFIPGWIPDLSIPDHIFTLPFAIFGLTAVSGMALIMGITIFVQQKMTVTDPNQKAMIYMMPVMLTFMFSNLPSGLNLYYLTFNLLGIIQQVWQTKFSKNTLTKEDLKKMPVKEGWLARKMREAQELAGAQGHPVQGAVQGRPKHTNTNKSKK